MYHRCRSHTIRMPGMHDQLSGAIYIPLQMGGYVSSMHMKISQKHVLPDFSVQGPVANIR